MAQGTAESTPAQREETENVPPPAAPAGEPHTGLYVLLRSALESVQDIIVLGLCAVLFFIMVRALWDLGQGALHPNVDVRGLLSQILFVTLLVELYRLLVVYLREHRVAVDFVVEITLVSALREVVLHGVTEVSWDRLLAITAFVLALGTLRLVIAWVSVTAQRQP